MPDAAQSGLSGPEKFPPASDKPRVFGIKTGLCIVGRPENAVGFADLRAFTYDDRGNLHVHEIDLTYEEAVQLGRALEALTGDRDGGQYARR